MQLVAEVDSVDVQTFQFKRQRRIQVFNPSVNLPSNQLDLVAAASRFGLLFVGSPELTLNVFQINDVVDESGTKCPRRIISLPSIPVHVSINCDNELLSVVLHKNNALVAVIYDTRSFINDNPTISKEIQLYGSPGVQLSSLVWNPCISDSLAVCLSDGSLSIFQCKINSIELQTKMTNACCLSWSPKGKQIVTGNTDGTINQYKPDLTLVKNIPAPQLYENNASLQVLAIHWISNYQFNVVYNNPSDPENNASVTIVNTPKGGTNTCVNYEDICYSMGTLRNNQFFLIHLPLWGIILTSSANSMEVGVLGTKDQTNWQQWIQMDEGRAELPLTDDKQENYPIGVCFDNASTIQLPWGDAAILPFMPMLHILSHTGALVSFFAINVDQTAPPLCQNPEFLRIPAHLLVLENPSTIQAPPQPAAAVSNAAQDFSFAISQNTITSTPTLPKTERSNTGLNNMLPNKLFSSVTNNIKLENTQFGDVKNQQVIQQPIGDIAQDVKPQGLNVLSKSSTLDFSTENIQKPAYSEKAKNNNLPISGEKSYKSDIQSVPNAALAEMLLKEINAFQMEQYELFQRCYCVNTEIGTDEEMNKIATILSNCKIDPLNDIWSDEDIKKQMVILKQNLINTCAFIAEAKLQPVSLEIEQLVQLDPVSASKMSSIKLNSYYIESQLKQVNCVLNEQWQIFKSECETKAKALRGITDNDHMKIPTLDKIYQPLLKQSDILSKQQFIVATLEKKIESLNLANNISNLKNQSLMKLQSISTKSMSQLSNDLLNMSVESETTMAPKYTIAQEKVLKEKNDALRKLLINYNTVKIKPTKIEPTSMMQSFYDWESDKLKNEKAANESKINNANLNKVLQENVPPFKSNDDNISQSIKATNPLTNLNNFVSSLSTSEQSSFLKYTTTLQKNDIKLVSMDKLNNQTKESIGDKISFDAPKTTSAEIVSSCSAFTITKVSATASTPASTFGNFTSSFTPPKTAPVLAPPVDKSEKNNIFQPPQPLNSMTLIKNPNDSIAITTLSSKPTTTSKNAPFNFQFDTQTKPSSFSFTLPNPPDSKPSAVSIAAPAIFNAPISTTAIFNKNVAPTFNFNPNKSLQADGNTNDLVTPKPIIPDPATIFKNASLSTSSISITKVDVSSPKPEISLEKLNAAPDKNSATKNTEIIKSPNVTVITPTSDTIVKTNSEPIVSTPTEKKIVPEPITFPSPVSSPSNQDAPAKPLFGFNISQINITPTAPATTSVETNIFGGSTQSPAISTFDSTNKPAQSVFGTIATTSAPSIFGAAAPANTCASSLFGAANAAIDTSITSMLGGSNIFGTNTSVFGGANKPAFNGGNLFGGRTSFGQSGDTTFGAMDDTKSPFGQKIQPNSIFGGGSAFGSTQPSTQTTNIFGQTPQTNTFGNNATSPQNNIFGGSDSMAKSTFGSPAQTSPQQNSLFGGGATQTSAPVFGGSPTFGSKSVFGQQSGFGSPPAFGAFGAADQPSVAQSGFGSPSSFGKPTGGFGGSPKFGSSPSFGSSSGFGGSPTFGNNAAKFGGSPGMQSNFGQGTQQSSTFENLANQSGLSFGNLAQQSQQPAPPAPAFQVSSSFSTWR